MRLSAYMYMYFRVRNIKRLYSTTTSTTVTTAATISTNSNLRRLQPENFYQRNSTRKLLRFEIYRFFLGATIFLPGPKKKKQEKN